MAVKAEVEQLDTNKVLLKVEVDAEEVSKAIDQAFRAVAREVFIPGFRKGRVPRRVLQARLGMEPIYEQVLENNLPEYYSQALEETGIEPVSDPDIDEVEIEEGKPLTFQAKVEVKPVIEIEDYKGIEVSEPDRKVTGEELSEALDRLRERFARLEPMPGRKIAKGDFALIDFNGTVNNQPLEGGSAQDFMYEVGKEILWPEFDKELEGKRVGDILDVRVKIPEDFEDPDVAGSIASFKVIIKEVKVKKLPELNDDFAKEASAFDTLEELKADMLEKLGKIKEEQAEAKIRDAILEKLVDKLEVDLPQGMIDRYVRRRKERIELGLKDMGLTLDKYLEYSGYTMEKMDEQLTEDAIRSIKTELILEEVANRENLQVGDDELEEALREQANRSGVDAERFRQMLEEKNAMEYFRGELRLEKALKFLRDNAVLISEESGKPVGEAKERGSAATTQDQSLGEEEEAGGEKSSPNE